MILCDAHNHLHDPRLAPWRDDLPRSLASAGIAAAVVNGTGEHDWSAVATLADKWPSGGPRIRMAFGVHPWRAAERSGRWEQALHNILNARPEATIGEIGLDAAIAGADAEDQKRLFIRQMAIAAERTVAATIHCVRAWEILVQSLDRCAIPGCGYLIHAWNGPASMVSRLVDLGAYFSFGPGHLHPRAPARSAFRGIPAGRILLETDAPNLPPPARIDPYGLTDPETGRRLNHPGTLAAAATGLAETLELPVERIAELTTGNWLRLFGAGLQLSGD